MPVSGVVLKAWSAAALVTVALLSGCTAFADGTAIPAADLGVAPRPVPVGELESLLLDPGALNRIVGASALRVEDTLSAMYQGTTAASDCASVGQVPHGPSYAGSGWTALRAQYLIQEPSVDRRTNKTWQAVVSFPLAVDAQAFFARQVASWPTCDGRRVNLRYLDDPDAKDEWWTLSNSTVADGMLSVMQYQDIDTGWACQAALTVRNNVAVNVQVCTNDVANEAVEVATAIAKKIPVE